MSENSKIINKNQKFFRKLSPELIYFLVKKLFCFEYTIQWIDFSSKEITGTKPLRVRIPVNKYEQLVCKEFETSKQDLK